MTWVDNSGQVRPQSWEEYLTMKGLPSPDRVCDCPICTRIRQRESTYQLRRARYNADRVQRGRSPKADPVPRMRIRLFRADPHCFWCGVEVKLDLPHQHSRLATVDHLYSRFHPERKLKHQSQPNALPNILHVLACSSCNNKRSRCETRQEPFIPKLPERLGFAQRADATLAQKQRQDPHPASVLRQAHSPAPALSHSTLNVICTLEEAVKFARENPSR